MRAPRPLLLTAHIASAALATGCGHLFVVLLSLIVTNARTSQASRCIAAITRQPQGNKSLVKNCGAWALASIEYRVVDPGESMEYPTFASGR